MTNAVHRIVEQRASAAPDTIAISGGSPLTYGELNQRANALARRLCTSGLTRRSLVFVRMTPSTDLAIVLLAVLKAGACYAWVDPGTPDQQEFPASFCIQRSRSAGEDEYLAIDIACALRETAAHCGPNLAVLTRGPEVACVLPDANGRPTVLVPHATISALPRARARLQMWEGSAGAFDLWMALMSGITLSLGMSSPATAAA